MWRRNAHPQRWLRSCPPMCAWTSVLELSHTVSRAVSTRYAHVVFPMVPSNPCPPCFAPLSSAQFQFFQNATPGHFTQGLTRALQSPAKTRSIGLWPLAVGTEATELFDQPTYSLYRCPVIPTFLELWQPTSITNCHLFIFVFQLLNISATSAINTVKKNYVFFLIHIFAHYFHI